MKELFEQKTKLDVMYNVVQDFPREGVRFIDFTPSVYNISYFMHLVNKLKDELPECDYIISPDARGFIWGSGVSLVKGVGMIPIRKAGKLPPQVVGSYYTYNTEYSTETLEIPLIDLTGKKVVFIDDVYATGGTYEAAKRLVSDRGGELIAGKVIYDIGIKDSDILSLFKGDDL